MLAKVKQSPWITLAILSSIGLITMHAETMLLPAIPDKLSIKLFIYKCGPTHEEMEDVL
jgi:hypothetical protein